MCRTWKDLTGNVNLLADNLTNQVRAIAEVQATKGDLTRSIQVEARGEVAELKDNINTMIDNLRLTTDRNKEQDWLKTNLARFTGMLQGQRDLGTVGRMLLSELAPLVNAQQGVIYQMGSNEPAAGTTSGALVLLSTFADTPEGLRQRGKNRGGPGRPVCLGKAPHVDLRPAEEYCSHSLGALQGQTQKRDRAPGALEDRVKAVIELASLERLHRLAACVSRAAYGEHRHCAELH